MTDPAPYAAPAGLEARAPLDITPVSRRSDVSVLGVLVLSAVSVLTAVAGTVVLALAMVGAWWVISHIPVPPIVWHCLAAIGLG